MNGTETQKIWAPGLCFFLYTTAPSSCPCGFHSGPPPGNTYQTDLSCLLSVLWLHPSRACKLGLRVKTSVGGEKKETEFPWWGPQGLLHLIPVYSQGMHISAPLQRAVGSPRTAILLQMDNLRLKPGWLHPIRHTPPTCKMFSRVFIDRKYTPNF